ncbi:hypothetical protein [Cellulomonas marina]|uniref:Uncharacterized protein n=1 Tax=Cellulomonas marina TaxID=988821 RepID=A0A1I1AJN6_9CELL|nr:hypothetical protein [Cellulomonas marina]GIG30151.1 hypothetical protein Cma02nite_27510 [Cellulomonas marina]SFB38234.1 hypothetical protein SAMN05421867_11928 [Cellulomonas marina]
MDGIAGIGGRIAAIESGIAELRTGAGVATATTWPAGAAGGVLGMSTLAGPSSSAGGTTTGTTTGTAAGSFASVLADQVARSTTGATTGAATTTAPGGPLPAVAGFTAEQVGNAAAIVAAGRALGLSVRDQTIGVMTAMGESSLRNVDHGDAAGPDSIGLFQQRDNGAWGTLADRTDPTRSATAFFRALQGVAGRDAMAPTLVAHAVQRNADPQHYASRWADAVRVVGALTGAATTGA